MDKKQVLASLKYAKQIQKQFNDACNHIGEDKIWLSHWKPGIEWNESEDIRNQLSSPLSPTSNCFSALEDLIEIVENFLKENFENSEDISL